MRKEDHASRLSTETRLLSPRRSESHWSLRRVAARSATSGRKGHLTHCNREEHSSNVILPSARHSCVCVCAGGRKLAHLQDVQRTEIHLNPNCHQSDRGRVQWRQSPPFLCTVLKIPAIHHSQSYPASGSKGEGKSATQNDDCRFPSLRTTERETKRRRVRLETCWSPCVGGAVAVWRIRHAFPLPK